MIKKILFLLFFVSSIGYAIEVRQLSDQATLTTSEVTFATLTSNSSIKQKTSDGVIVYSMRVSTSLADTQQVALSFMDGHAGWGYIMATDGSKADFTFTAAGAVTLVSDDNADTADNHDATLNVFDSGTTITIENQLGGTYILVGEIFWY